MKWSKRIFCMLFACSIILLSACGAGNKEKENNMESRGRYVETDITPPADSMFTSFLDVDGIIVCFDPGLVTRYESADGGLTWTEKPGPGAQSDRYWSVTAGTLMEDGSLLVFIQGEGLFIVAPDGSSQPYYLSELDEMIAGGEPVMVSLLQVLHGNRLLLSFMKGGFMQVSTRGEGPTGGPEPGSGPVTRGSGAVTNDGPQGPGNGSPQRVSGQMIDKTLLYDLTTDRNIAELQTANVLAATSDDSNLYLLDMSGNITTYSLSDGNPAKNGNIQFWEDRNGGGMVMQGFGMMTGALAASGNGLYASHEGALLLATNDGAVSTVLDSTSYSIGTPRSNITSVFVLDDGAIVVNLRTGETNRLYKYVWDENSTLNPNQSMTIWSLNDNDLVRAAIAEFRKKHPDVSITYEIALEDDNAQLASDAIKTLNTRLINGSGPDVIILDGCPADSYADKGMLLELSALIDTGDIYENLISSYISDGKLYYMPTQFMMPLLMGNPNALAKATTLDRLVELVLSGNEAPPLPEPGTRFSGIPEGERAEVFFNDLQELCDVLWLASAPTIISENKLDTDALGAYIEAVKAISDKYSLARQEQDEGMQMGLAFADGGNVTQLPGSLMRYTAQQTNYAAFTVSNLQLLQLMMERDGSEIVLLPGLAPGAWEPSTVAGISADTSVPELAAGFISAMLSTDVQQLNYGTGLPVTKQGIAAQISFINDRLERDGRGSFLIDIDTLIEQLQIPSMGDVDLAGMISPSVERCCKGEISVGEAVKEIEQNVKNYLAERS